MCHNVMKFNVTGDVTLYSNNAYMPWYIVIIIKDEKFQKLYIFLMQNFWFCPEMKYLQKHFFVKSFSVG